MEAEMKELIKKNLPEQVGEALQKELTELKLLREKIPYLEKSAKERDALFTLKGSLENREQKCREESEKMVLDRQKFELEKRELKIGYLADQVTFFNSFLINLSKMMTLSTLSSENRSFPMNVNGYPQTQHESTTITTDTKLDKV